MLISRLVAPCTAIFLLDHESLRSAAKSHLHHYVQNSPVQRSHSVFEHIFVPNTFPVSSNRQERIAHSAVRTNTTPFALCGSAAGQLSRVQVDPPQYSRYNRMSKYHCSNVRSAMGSRAEEKRAKQEEDEARMRAAGIAKMNTRRLNRVEGGCKSSLAVFQAVTCAPLPLMH